MSKKDTYLTWIRLEEFAKCLRLSRSKFYDLAQSGKVPCSKVAGRWRFFLSEAAGWMLRQRDTPIVEEGGVTHQRVQLVARPVFVGGRLRLTRSGLLGLRGSS